MIPCPHATHAATGDLVAFPPAYVVRSAGRTVEFEFSCTAADPAFVCGKLTDGNDDVLAHKHLLLRPGPDGLASLLTVRGQTDAKGEFVIRSPVHRRASVCVRVVEPDLAVTPEREISSWYIASHERAKSHSVTASAVAPWRLRLLTPAGVPARGAAVEMFARQTLFAVGVSDAAGRVEIVGVNRQPIDSVRLVARSPDGVLDTTIQRAGSLEDLGDHQLEPPMVIVGRVIDRHRAPARGVQVHLAHKPTLTWTDRNGNFAFRGLPPGSSRELRVPAGHDVMLDENAK